MKKYAILVFLSVMLGIGNVSACTTNDAWTGQDKTKHFIVGAAIASSGTLVFKNPNYGFIAGVGIGLAKEIYDTRGHGTCSFQDFAVTALGAAAGAYGTAWIITPRFIGYSKRF